MKTAASWKNVLCSTVTNSAVRHVPDWKGQALIKERKVLKLGELIIREVEWRGNALKRLPWYSDWRFWEIEVVRSSVKSAERYRKSAEADTKAVQRWMMYHIGRGSIKYIWRECLKQLTNLRMYGSIARLHRNVQTAKVQGQWGKVRFSDMKYLAVLRALPSCQD